MACCRKLVVGGYENSNSLHESLGNGKCDATVLVPKIRGRMKVKNGKDRVVRSLSRLVSTPDRVP